MVRAFEETLKMTVLVPPHYEVMGAIGAAILFCTLFVSVAAVWLVPRARAGARVPAASRSRSRADLTAERTR